MQHGHASHSEECVSRTGAGNHRAAGHRGGGTGDTAVASTRTQSVSGVEIADQLVKNLNHVALGSSGATATLDVDGAPHDVGLDIGGLQSGITGGKGSGMVGLAIVSAAAAGLLRAAAALARLFR